MDTACGDDDVVDLTAPSRSTTMLRPSVQESHGGVKGPGRPQAPPASHPTRTVVLDVDDDDDEEEETGSAAALPRSGSAHPTSQKRGDEDLDLWFMQSTSHPGTQELPVSSQSQQEHTEENGGRRKRKAAASTVDKEERARQKEMEKEQKKAAKEEEKRLKAEQREVEKKRKAEAKAAEKARQQAAKDAEKWKSRQERGAFADQEISVMVEAQLHASPTGILLVEALKNKYHVSPPQDFPVRGLIRWERRSCAVDDAENAAAGAVMVDHLVVVWSGEDFLKLVEEAQAAHQPLITATGDFPFLQQAIEGIRRAHPTYATIRLCLVLQGVKEEIARRTRQEYNRIMQQNWTAQACQFKVEQLEEALVWIHLCQNVDTKLTSSVDDTIQYMMDMTRAWAEAPYRKKITALECVSKPKDTALGYDRNDKSLRSVVANTFLRQLIMIPGLSSAKAQALLKHFPTPRSLVDSLSDPRLSVKEREHLLADKMGGKNFAVLSKRVYTVFTSQDPDLIITTNETGQRAKKAKETAGS